MAQITNQIVLEKLSKTGNAGASEWLHSMHTNISKKAFSSSITRLKGKKTKLMKDVKKPNGEQAFNDFLKSIFQLPSTKPTTRSSLGSELARLDIDKDDNVKAAATATLEQTVGEQKQQIKDKDERIQNLQQLVKKRTERKVLEKNEELKRVRASAEYYRKKSGKLEEKVSDIESGNKLGTLEEQLQGLQADNEELTKQNEELIHMLEEQQMQKQDSKSTIETYDTENNKYTTDLQRCVHKLLDQSVSTNRVVPVIESVLELAGVQANRLPSTTTIRNINVQRLTLAHEQIREEVAPAKNTTVETDESSYYGAKKGAYVVRTEEGRPYVLGLRDLLTKSGQNTLNTFKEILWDIDTIYYKGTDYNEASQNILFHIRNTMSDRAATEHKFNELLESYRSEVLPQMIDQWEDLHEDVKERLTRLNNFFCGLHGLVHMAESANTALLEVEKSYFTSFEKVPIHNPKFRKATESAVCRLVRTACQAFSYGGDAKNGCHGKFMVFIKDYLKENNMHSLPITPYRGNRFNIVFHNASCIYWLKDNMLEFLTADDTNRWVKHDMQIPFFIAGVKALGLVNKLITTPLWAVIESKTVSIMDMNNRYERLVEYLKKASNDCDQFIIGNLLLYNDVSVKDDIIYQSLISPSDFDGLCCVILRVMLPAMAKLCQNVYKDHLKGGRYEGLQEELRETTRSVVPHNKFCETIFAYYDRLLMCKPHIGTLAAEAQTMFVFNKTSAWLSVKDPDEEKQLLEAAYKQVNTTKATFQRRQQMIEKEKAAQLKEKRKKADQLEQKRVNDRIQNTNQIIHWGLWQTETEINDRIQELTPGDKVKALKAQLKFRKHVLHQKVSDMKWFNFTVAVPPSNPGGKPAARCDYKPEELQQNLTKIVQETTSSDSEDQLQAQPSDLVGRSVKHRFADGTWYKGTVLSQVQGQPDWYNVKYDDDDATYTFQLMDDMRNGDLEVVGEN